MMKASSEYTAPKASLRRLQGRGRDGGDEQVPQQARQDGVLKAVFRNNSQVQVRLVLNNVKEYTQTITPVIR